MKMKGICEAEREGHTSLDIFANHMDSLLQTGSYSYLRIHTLLPQIVTSEDMMLRADDLEEEEHVFLWSPPKNSGAFMSQGSIESKEFTGADRFREAHDFANTVSERSLDIVWVPDQGFSPACGQDQWVQSAMKCPLLVGGFAFSADLNDTRSLGPWSGYPDGYLWMPEILVQTAPYSSTGEGAATATVALGINGFSSWEGVEAHALRLLDGLKSLSKEKKMSGHSPRYFIGDENGEIGDIETRNKEADARDSWVSLVQKAVDSIRRQEFSKVVLARFQEMTRSHKLKIGVALSRLLRKYPDCHTFMANLPHRGSFFGASPERLVKREGKSLETTALAGTKPRQASETFEALSSQLLNSQKDLEEHKLVVDEIKSTLEPLCDRLEVPERPCVRSLRNVLHLETPITGEVDNKKGNILTLVDALHPTPALGGVPRGHALTWMKENEGWERGWYAAPVGWMNRYGDGEFIVGIRTALAKDTKTYLFAGCGIVAASDPDNEWEETQAKLKAIQAALRSADDDVKCRNKALLRQTS